MVYTIKFEHKRASVFKTNFYTCRMNFNKGFFGRMNVELHIAKNAFLTNSKYGTMLAFLFYIYNHKSSAL